MVSSSLMCFTFYISSFRRSSLVVLHSSLRSSLFIRHLVICLLHLVTHHSSFVTHHFVTRRSSRVVLHLVTCLSHLVTSFFTRHSSVTSHAPSESYKRTRAVAVVDIPCAVNTATVSQVGYILVCPWPRLGVGWVYVCIV